MSAGGSAQSGGGDVIQALRTELEESRMRIEDILSRQVSMLSYPHGKVNKAVRSTAVEAGYRFGLGSRFGANFADTDPMVLRRTEVWAADSVRVFRQKCAGAWDWYGYYQSLRGL